MIFNKNPENYKKELELLGAMSIKLLWENASPKSAFVAQTINVDFSEYDGIIIDFYATETQVKMLEDYTGVLNVHFIYKASNGLMCVAHREVLPDIVNKKTITFNESGWITFTTTTGTKTVDNNTIIPLFIYGIKGVQ